MTTPLVDVSKTPVMEVSTNFTNVTNVDGQTVCGLYVPGNLTGTVLTFRAGVSALTSTLAQVRDKDSDALSITVAAPEAGDDYSYVFLPLAAFAGVQFLQIIADSAQTGTDAQFILSVRPV